MTFCAASSGSTAHTPQFRGKDSQSGFKSTFAPPGFWVAAGAPNETWTALKASLIYGSLPGVVYSLQYKPEEPLQVCYDQTPLTPGLFPIPDLEQKWRRGSKIAQRASGGAENKTQVS